jgi:L-threonylcarbamoyladenylate synthase
MKDFASFKTELLDACNEVSTESSIARAAALLTAGAVVAFPTDTVYGVGAAANQPNAVARLFRVKGRPPDKAIPILIADVNDLYTVVTECSETVTRLIAEFWPGALTLVLSKRDTIPTQVSSTPNVAVRQPGLSLTRRLIAAVGVPLAVTSANRSGQPSPCTALEVMTQLNGRIAAVVDGGTCPGGIPSTILDCSAEPPRILRDGAIPADAIRRITPLA